MRRVVPVHAVVLIGTLGLLRGQSVGIGTSAPHPSARLDVVDNERGVLIPRMTTAERDAITNPARSLLIYNLDCDVYQYYIPGTGWVTLLNTGGGGGGGGGVGTLIAHPPTNVGPNGFTAHWTPVAGATGYQVRVYQSCNSSTLITTVNVPNGTASSQVVNISVPCNSTLCYEVQATVSTGSGCGNSSGVLVSNRVPLQGQPFSCTSSNSWAQLANPPLPGRENHITIAHKGKIYVGLGHSGLNCLGDWWRWEPCSGTWTQLTSPPTALLGGDPFAFSIGDYIYVGGGRRGCGGPTAAFYRYDPANDTWTQRADLPVAITSARGASDGSYGYIAGLNVGTNSPSALSGLYRYDPVSDSWSLLTNVPVPVRALATITYWQGKLYIAGGINNDWSGPCYADFHVYDLTAGTWSSLTSHPNNHYDGFSIAFQGKIYITGHHGGSGGGCSSTTSQFHYYNIATGQWVPMANFPGGNRNNLHLAEVDGILYGGLGAVSGGGATVVDWWAYCPY